MKMIDPPKRTSTYERPFTQEGNYLVYDFLMLHVYYIYVDILHDDVTVSNKTYSYMDCQLSLHTFSHYFAHFIYMLYIQQ